jgi:uncharacterized membrane protein
MPGLRRFISVLVFGEGFKLIPCALELIGVPMKREIAIGLAVVAGAAVLEAALIPGLIIGGAVWLAPRILSNRRGKADKPRANLLPIGTTQASSRQRSSEQPSQLMAKSQLGRTIAKTITFRLIVTTLDFTTNYIVIGELATAAGLSTFNLIAGPLFYFGHEAVWNYLGPAETHDGVRVQLPTPNPDETAWLTISPALAKTITYRTIATVVDFTTNYVVVGSVAEATILSATGFFLGPFVYYGHEKAWEYFGGDTAEKTAHTKEIALLPAT